MEHREERWCAARLLQRGEARHPAGNRLRSACRRVKKQELLAQVEVGKTLRSCARCRIAKSSGSWVDGSQAIAASRNNSFHSEQRKDAGWTHSNDFP